MESMVDSTCTDRGVFCFWSSRMTSGNALSVQPGGLFFMQRFWSKVKKTRGCWIWQAALVHGKNEGYGRFKLAGKTRRAHRVSWEMEFGPVFGGLHVLHSCDNPPCVRPSHLYLGNDAANAKHRGIRGRAACGEKSAQSSLTEKIVLEIRRKARGGATKAELSKEYKITDSAMGCIVRRKTWKHI